MIEPAAAKVPSGAYLTIAVAAMAGSLALMLAGRRNVASFVGQWAPTILIVASATRR
jgi:hypothetical protein